MKDKLINDSEVMNNTKLLQFCKFRFEIYTSKGTIYKEDFHQEFIKNRNSKVKDKISTSIFNHPQKNDNDIIKFYSESYRFSNLYQIESLLIKDGGLFYEYSEYTDQSIIVPIIYNPVYMLLSAISVCQKISNSFSANTFSVVFSTHNNTRSCFDARYSPLECKFNWLFTYDLTNNSLLNIELNNIDDIYNVARRFFQLFKTNIKSDIPYVILDQGSFNNVYESFLIK